MQTLTVAVQIISYQGDLRWPQAVIPAKHLRQIERGQASRHVQLGQARVDLSEKKVAAQGAGKLRAVLKNPGSSRVFRPEAS